MGRRREGRERRKRGWEREGGETRRDREAKTTRLNTGVKDIEERESMIKDNEDRTDREGNNEGKLDVSKPSEAKKNKTNEVEKEQTTTRRDLN